MKARAREPNPPKQPQGTGSAAPAAEMPVPRPGARGTAMRRTQRVFLSVPVTVYGWSADGQVFNEPCVTIVINANGAMLAIRSKVRERQDLFVRNENTGSEIKCFVVHTAPAEGGRTEVGISFCEQAPGFWGVYFPPEAGGATARP